MSAYLSMPERDVYGVSDASPSQIHQASAIIDAYIKRAEGIVYGVDYAGMPCDMECLSPSLTFTLSAPIAPGLNVVAPLTGPTSALQVGDVLVLDRATQNIKEAVTVGSITGGPSAPQITLSSVACSHSAGATAAAGLVIDEQKYMPESRPITFVSRAPLVRIHNGVGRYGYGRRGDGGNYALEQFNLLAAVSKFGGPPAWEMFQVGGAQGGFDAMTGQVWIPAGIMLAYYSEVKLRFISGFQESAIPQAIKVACAKILRASMDRPQMGMLKSYKAGDTAVEMFAASCLDEDTKLTLAPYCARLFV